MAKIIRFPVERAKAEAAVPLVMDGPTAEIIIFPGIRIDMDSSDFALAN